MKKVYKIYNVVGTLEDSGIAPFNTEAEAINHLRTLPGGAYAIVIIWIKQQAREELPPV